ncbi:MAG TPA: SDR family oxidoreductase [Myxococcota bacterium]|nr:SDR family oxidoreductase [Myxococcota bacterium]
MAGEWSVRGEVGIVTGATSGIGEEIAIGLARAGAKLAIVARNRERGETSAARIRAAVPGATVDLLLADLASQESIRKLAAEILAKYPRIAVLVNNAGVANMKRHTTTDGFEATFAVNHLAYFQLTMLLLERLRASAPARIVNVASDAHKFGKLDLSDLQNERKYAGMRVYGQSKTANILFTRELAKRLAGSGVTVNCIHPGAVATRLGQQNGAYALILTKVLSPFFRTPAKGADTAVWLATAPELAGRSGGYYYSRKELTPAKHATDPALAEELFAVSGKLVGIGV